MSHSRRKIREIKREGWQSDFHTFLEDQANKELSKKEKLIEERIKNDQSDIYD